MANINFKYDYPYIGFGEKGRFQYQWSESRTILNRCYTYPLLFGLLYFSLTRRTPKPEDLQIVQQYFTKFLCEIAEGQPS